MSSSVKMSSSGFSRRKSNQAANITRSFLSTTNPEIFIRKPRPGGFVKVIDPYAKKKKCDDEKDDATNDGTSMSTVTTATTATSGKTEKKVSIQESLQERISREFRIQKTIHESVWTLSTLTSGDESDVTVEVPTPLEDSIEMMCCALSTVMLLAADARISETYCDWTMEYFKCIKDDFGHIPPNIQGMMNHINFLKLNGGIGAQATATDLGGDGEGEDGSRRASKTVRTTTTVRRKSGSVGSAGAGSAGGGSAGGGSAGGGSAGGGSAGGGSAGGGSGGVSAKASASATATGGDDEAAVEATAEAEAEVEADEEE